MRGRLVSALLIAAFGLLPGSAAVGCPSVLGEAAHAHAPAGHLSEPACHHHGVSEVLPTLGPCSLPDTPSRHSSPGCCCGCSQAAQTAVREGVSVGSPDALPAPGVAALLALEPQPSSSARDPRALRPDERCSPYVRTRAPLLI